MIINGELETGLGGGVCQVSTTVFNAAYEAGLPITSRTNHALYISHYPLGRDATVDYPNIDLKFVNDTGKWLLLRTFVGSSSLVVNLYGTPQNRRVETETAPLARRRGRRRSRSGSTSRSRRASEVVAVVRRPGAVDVGAPHASTRPSGKLLSDSTWVSNYESEPKIVLYRAEEEARSRRRHEGRAEATTRRPTATTGRRRPATPTPLTERLRSSDRLDEPGREARRPQRRRVDGAVRASSRRRSSTPSRVIAYSKRKRAPRTSRQRACTSSRSSKTRRREEARVRLEHERLDPLVAQPLVAARVPLEVVDAGDLEPDEVVRVVRDALRVGLGEAHADRRSRS